MPGFFAYLYICTTLKVRQWIIHHKEIIMYFSIFKIMMFMSLLSLTACTQNQVGTSAGGAAGAGLGYAVSKNAWGAAIGGAAGALIGNELSKNR